MSGMGDMPRSFIRGQSVVLEARLVQWWLMALLLCAAFLVTGCSVGPDYVKPSAPEMEAWLEREDPEITEEPSDFRDWWTVFNDPVLNTLTETAHQQNLDVLIAGLRILEARAQLGVAVGRLYPQLQQASGGYNVVQISKNAPNAAFGDKFFYDYQVGLDTAWELDFWGRFRRAIESADANLGSSIANYDDVLVTLLGDVATTYVALRTLEERLSLARQNVKVQERTLEIAEVRFKNGLVTELDATQARSLLRETQALIPTFEASISQAKHALSFLLGMPPNELKEILGEEPRPIPTGPAEVAVGIPADLLRRRPDIQRAERQMAAQSALIGVAESELYPSISLVGSIGLQSSEKGGIFSNNASFDDLFEAGSLTYFFGPTVQWPILNYGRIRNQVRVQDARFQQLLVNFQNTVLRAYQEVEDAMVGFVKSQQEAALLQDAVQASKRSLEISLIQYREGIVDFQRVLDTERALVSEQDRLADTTGSISLNLVGMYKALGGGWQIREGEDFVPEQTKETMRTRTNWGGLLAPEQIEPTPVYEDPKVLEVKWPDW